MAIINIAKPLLGPEETAASWKSTVSLLARKPEPHVPETIRLD